MEFGAQVSERHSMLVLLQLPSLTLLLEPLAQLTHLENAVSVSRYSIYTNWLLHSYKEVLGKDIQYILTPFLTFFGGGIFITLKCFRS